MEDHRARRDRLLGYLNTGAWRPGVHKDTKCDSVYPWFALWEDGGDGFDTKREAQKALKDYSTFKAYEKEEYGIA